MKNKLLVAVVIGVALALLGCSANIEPDNELINKYQSLSADLTALQNEFNVLQFNYENLKEVKAERDECRESYNALTGNFTALQTEIAILKAHYQTVSDQYNALATSFSVTKSGDDKTLEQINRQYKDLLEGQKELNAQIQAVWDEEVELLSDNLTNSEYKAFYKGWELWWDSFN